MNYGMQAAAVKVIWLNTEFPEENNDIHYITGTWAILGLVIYC